MQIIFGVVAILIGADGRVFKTVGEGVLACQWVFAGSQDCHFDFGHMDARGFKKESRPSGQRTGIDS